MINMNKAQLIKKLEQLGEKIILRGMMFKELSYSIKQYQDQKTMKEWMKQVKPLIDREMNILNFERGFKE